MAADRYFSPETRGESEFKDRKSTFLGHAAPVENEEQAKAFVSAIKREYADARHNVWAYSLHDGTLRASDDGEPAGTGGAPITDAIVKRGLTDAVVVVTRYFGGILLGTGGLVHAYSTAASQALDAAGRAQVLPYMRVRIDCSYAQYGGVLRLCEKFAAKVEKSDFEEVVTALLLLPEEECSRFDLELSQMSCGALSAEKLGKTALRTPV